MSGNDDGAGTTLTAFRRRRTGTRKGVAEASRKRVAESNSSDSAGEGGVGGVVKTATATRKRRKNPMIQSVCFSKLSY
ncbi:unnamed protein product [Gongylonema pulchrum]|uniref:Uncharacterized protein n=1 Tax=Gongylonema pulchrum TaxID=637853 RepID=A0A183DQP2_9BILA|nr:unnamed protein product [Gongylonema pulchrum]